MFRTYMPKKEELQKKWYVVDAKDKVLGRLASRIAIILRGKHKPIYSPHLDCGDGVIVVNADKIKLTGRKLEKKLYYRHSLYPGGLRVRTAGEILKKNPAELIFLAVKGMLPKNKLRKRMLKHLRVYAGPDHPHRAQNPEPLEL